MAKQKEVKKERIHWIDIARGVGIILVLYGHLLGSDSFRYLIYAFHIPLFFFLSGMVFKNYPTQSFFSLLVKTAKQLLLPYLIIAFITFGIDFVKPPFHMPPTAHIDKQLYGIFFGSGNKGYLAFNVALWFLPCLFFTKMVFTVITRFIKNTKLQLSLVLLSGLAGIITSHYFTWLKLPFGIESGLTALVFFGAGYALKQKTDLLTVINQKKLLIGGLALVIFLSTAILNHALFGQQIDIRLNRLNNDLLFYLSATSGILLTLIICMRINKNQFLEYLGKNSLILFAWHTPIFVYLKLFMAMLVANQYAVPLWYGLQIAYLFFTGAVILGVNILLGKIKMVYAGSKEKLNY